MADAEYRRDDEAIRRKADRVRLTIYAAMLFFAMLPLLLAWLTGSLGLQP